MTKQKANKTLDYIFVFDQGSKRIKDKIMYIPNGNTQNNPFCKLQLVVENLGHSTL